MASEIPVSWEELERKVGKIEPGQILELNLLRKGFIFQTVYFRGFVGCLFRVHVLLPMDVKEATLRSPAALIEGLHITVWCMVLG